MKGGKPVINEAGQTIIYLKYGHDSKTSLFSTGIKINPKNWNDKKQLIDSTKTVKNIVANADLIKALEKEDNKSNAQLNLLKSKINSIVRDLQHNQVDPAIDLVKVEFEKSSNTSKEESKGFFDLFKNFIEETRITKAPNTIKQYTTCLNHLIAFQDFTKAKIKVQNIDLKFYDRFVGYLMNEKNLNNNSVGTAVKDLKVFLGYIKSRGIEVKTDLTQFKVLSEKKEILYHSQEELDILYNLEIPSNEKLKKKYSVLWHKLYNKDIPTRETLIKAKDIHVLECQTSLRVSDRKRLGKEHIKDSIIRMPAHKNKKPVFIPLTPKAKAILEKYDYVVPIVSEQKVNECIKAICLIAGFEYMVETADYRGGKKIYTKIPKWQLVTNHVAVKTFITHCGEKGISAKVVSEITGKTVKVILDHYYGTNSKVIEMEMQRAFGVVEAQMKVS
jgi:integrase